MGLREIRLSYICSDEKDSGISGGRKKTSRNRNGFLATAIGGSSLGSWQSYRPGAGEILYPILIQGVKDAIKTKFHMRFKLQEKKPAFRAGWMPRLGPEQPSATA